MNGIIEAVHKSALHTLKKDIQSGIQLLAGLGVESDVHMGVKVPPEPHHPLDRV